MVVFKNPVMAKIFDYTVANHRGVVSDVSERGTPQIVVPFLGSVHDYYCNIFTDPVNTDLHLMAPHRLMRPVLPVPFTTLGPRALAVNIHGRSFDMKRDWEYVYIHGENMVTTHPDILDNVAHILHYLADRSIEVSTPTQEFVNDLIPVLDLRY